MYSPQFSGKTTSSVCVWLKTEHCALCVSQKMMVGDAGFPGGGERWSAVFNTGVEIVLCAKSVGKDGE